MQTVDLALEAARAACREAGLDANGIELLRAGENTIYRLPGSIVIRVSRSRTAGAERELAVSRWLAASGVPAVTALPDTDQPIYAEGRVVTLWEELPSYSHGTPTEIAGALSALHSLPLPTDFTLPSLSPFARLGDRIASAITLQPDDRAWLRERLAALEVEFSLLPESLPSCVIHGDAGIGNIVNAQGVVTLLDLERFSIGPPEWDLVSTAVRFRSFGWISQAEYREFVRVYGSDVTEWAGYTLLRDIRELRMTCYLAQNAAAEPRLVEEAAHRVACIRGYAGPRPWTGWRPAI